MKNNTIDKLTRKEALKQLKLLHIFIITYLLTNNLQNLRVYELEPKEKGNGSLFIMNLGSDEKGTFLEAIIERQNPDGN